VRLGGVFRNYARHIADPDGFFKDAEENYLRRRLHISLMSDGMHAIDGILDPECGAAVKTALDSLAKGRGPEDNRTRARALAADLDTDSGAHRMRLHDLARVAGRLDGDRRRSGDASELGPEASRAAGQRQRLPVPGLRPAGQLVDSTPHRRLDERRTEFITQPDPSLLLPPSARA
jgi:hypothetical protein